MTEVPDTPEEAFDDEAADHVAVIFFDALERIDRECVLCQYAARQGFFEDYGPVDGDGWPVDAVEEQT